MRRKVIRKGVGNVTKKWQSFIIHNTRNMWRINLHVSADAQCQNKKNVVKQVSGR